MAQFLFNLKYDKALGVCVNPLQGLKFAAPSLTGTKCNREGSEGLFTPVSPLAPPSCPPCLCSGGDHGRLAPSETSSNATTTQSLSLALSLSLFLLHLSKFQYHFEHCYLQKDWILRPMWNVCWSGGESEDSHGKQAWQEQVTSSNATITQQSPLSLCPSLPASPCPRCPLSTLSTCLVQKSFGSRSRWPNLRRAAPT